MTGPTRRSLLAGAALLPLAAALSACGGSPPEESKESGEAVGGTAGAPGAPVTEVTITSPASVFDITTVHVPVGRPVTFNYRNEHAGVPHNLHVQGGGIDDMTPVAPGRVVQTLTVTFPAAGDYGYLCDVHPETMVGVVKAA